MRRVYKNIAIVEKGDDLQTIAQWLTKNTDVNMENNETAYWVNVVKEGDLFLFNAPYGMYRFNSTVKQRKRGGKH